MEEGKKLRYFGIFLSFPFCIMGCLAKLIWSYLSLIYFLEK
ncbi:hypothetical protein Hanom_Chr09g00866411 [Helianthus anomalus]